MDNDIARESFFLGFYFLSATDNHFALNGNNGLKDFVFEVHGFDSGFEGFNDFVFVAGIGVDNIPSGVKRRFA